MIVALMYFDNFARWALNVPPARPMRVEDEDGELEVERPEPIEDDREYGNPVGTDDPCWPYSVNR